MRYFLPLVCVLLVVVGARAVYAGRQIPGTDGPVDIIKHRRHRCSGHAADHGRRQRFRRAAGWSISGDGPGSDPTAPEGDSHIALVNVGSGKDADAAVAAAWAAYDAEAGSPLKLASDRLVRDGWEQVRAYRYDTTVNEKRGVSALARRRGERWTVTIFDLTNAVSEKRDAQIELIGRLLPKGYVRETFARKDREQTRRDAHRDTETVHRERAQQFDVLGVAIGIVQDGEVVLAEGFGVRELGKPDKVDVDTLFMVASNTKAMTTLMLAKLGRTRQVDLEHNGHRGAATFKLGDADTTRRVLMKHLVCACTGLPRQDMESIFEGERLTPESVVATLATMRPTSQFGELYQYSNLMADAAGFAGAHALYPQLELGAAYNAAMQTLVFDPLGMTSTTFDFAHAQHGNHAAPHGQDVERQDECQPAWIQQRRRSDPTRRRSVEQCQRHVALRADGTRQGPASRRQTLHRRSAIAGASRATGGTGNDTGYGMGLKIDRSMGTPLVQHGGVAFGFISNMLWLPEHNVGAVILTNTQAGGTAIRNLFRRRWLEVLFDGNRGSCGECACGSQEHERGHRRPTQATDRAG